MNRKLTALMMALLLLFGMCGCDTGEKGPFVPSFCTNDFTENEELKEGVIIDVSTASDGYFGISLLSDKDIKVQVIFDEVTYTYEVPEDGSVAYIPFQMGSGSYIIRVMKNTTERKYYEYARKELDVQVKDEFVAFKHANVYCDYNAESACVAKAAELAASSKSEKDFVKKVYTYLQRTIRYDDEFAASVVNGYMPNPDRTLETKKGICFDYAALAAAMFRSQGLPAKIITGYVGKDALYHAWNAVYTEESGWISIEISAKGNSWTRLDITYAATGGDNEKLYVNRYTY